MSIAKAKLYDEKKRILDQMEAGQFSNYEMYRMAVWKLDFIRVIMEWMEEDENADVV